MTVERPILLALGANAPSQVGPPQATLETGLLLLQNRGVAVKARSAWIRTPAHPPGAGPDFLNGAVSVETALGPDALLATLHAVEAELGRSRTARWGPRVIDLDLIAYGDAVAPDMDTVRRWIALPPDAQLSLAPDSLILPHPRLQDRAFVLDPLLEIAPEWVHPALGLSVREMRAQLGPVSDG